MTALSHRYQDTWSKPRFGGVFRRMSRAGRSLVLGMSGKAWNPFFSVIDHVGRRSGRHFATPVAARRCRMVS